MLFTTLIMTIAYQSIVYLSPQNLEWITSEHFSISNLLWFVFVDQCLIECVTVAVIFWLIRVYASILNLYKLRLNIQELTAYQLKFLPLFLVAFFIFAPVSLTLRFLLHYTPDLDSAIYFEEYFYSTKLYLNYLTPTFLVGYAIININLIKQYNDQLGQVKKDLIQIAKPKIKERLFASDGFGELFLETDKILWVERENRKTMAFTSSNKYLIKENLTVLENKLDPDKFIRVNRRAIVSLEQILNYSFWEHDKYVVRMKQGEKEFVMSRERLQKVKRKILMTDNPLQ